MQSCVRLKNKVLPWIRAGRNDLMGLEIITTKSKRRTYRSILKRAAVIVLCVLMTFSASVSLSLTAMEPVTAEAAAFTGWKNVSGKWFYYAKGSKKTGWVTVEGKVYYIDAKAGRKTGFATISKKKYYFSKSGVMATGWQTINGYKYYMGGNGVIRTGWQTISGKKYYFWTASGKGHYSNTLATKFFSVGGKTYYSGNDGVIRTGWQTINGFKYHMDSTGAIQKGVQFIDGKKYYFWPSTGNGHYSNTLATKFFSVGGKTYYSGNDGVIRTGWQTINGFKYYMTGGGAIQKGWQTIDGKKYYFWTSTGNGHYSNTLATKFFNVDGKTYYAGTNGVIRTGWQIINGFKYHMDSTGAIQKGWQTIGGSKYYFWTSTKDGHYSNTMALRFFKLNGNLYYAGDDGRIRTGWQTINGNKYYMDNSGAIQNGWQTIDGEQYYFWTQDGDGFSANTLAVERYVDGKYVDANGVYRKNVTETVSVNRLSDWVLSDTAAETGMYMHFNEGDLLDIRSGYELSLYDINTGKYLCTYSTGMIVPKSIYASVKVRKADGSSLTDENLRDIVSRIKVTSAEDAGYKAALQDIRGSSRLDPSSGFFEIAHRGAARYAPQNTLAAFDLSQKLGFSAFETDIRFTKDNIPVILHNETIDQTSDGSGKIADLTLAQARKYEFGSTYYSGQKIPTLEEVVRATLKNGTHEYLELKTNPSDSQLRTIIDIVEKNGMAPQTTWLIWDTSPGILTKMNDLIRSDTAIGMLTQEMTEESISQALALKEKSGREFWISANHNTVSEDLIGLAHEVGLKVNVWTVNDNSTAFKFFKWGVDSITTDGIVNMKNYMEAIGYTPESASEDTPETDDAAAGNGALPETDEAQSAGCSIPADTGSEKLTPAEDGNETETTAQEDAAAGIADTADMVEAAIPAVSEENTAGSAAAAEACSPADAAAADQQVIVPAEDTASQQDTVPTEDAAAQQDTAPAEDAAAQQDTVPAEDTAAPGVPAPAGSSDSAQAEF